MKLAIQSVISLLFFVTTLVISIHGMEDPHHTNKVFFGPEKLPHQKHSITNKEIAIISKVGKEGHIALDAFSLTNNAIIEALQKAHARGALVTVNLDGTREENNKTAQKLSKAGITVFLFNHHKNRKNKKYDQVLHNKRLLAYRGDIDKYYVFEGSANFTHLSDYNQEMMILNHNPEYFQQHLINHNKISHYCKKLLIKNNTIQNPSTPSPIRDITKIQRTLVESTPQKNYTVNSFDTDIMKSIAYRINNTPSGESLDVTTMTLDDYSVVEALKNARARNVSIRLFVDSSCLKYGNRILNDLSNLGISISVFNPTQDDKVYNRYPKTLHRKSVVRTGKKPCVVITSANLTQQSNYDSNDCSFFPNNLHLTNILLEENNKLKERCSSFTSAKRARNLFNHDQQPKAKEPTIKKAKYEPAPSQLLMKLQQDFELLEKDTITSYFSGTNDHDFLYKRFTYLKNLYEDLKVYCNSTFISKTIKNLNALLYQE